MHPDLIVFDCDGVLVDSEVLSIAGVAAVLNEAGVPATYAMIARYFGMKQADIMLKVSEETGHDIPLEVSARIWPAIRDRFEARAEAHAGPGRLPAPPPGRAALRGLLVRAGPHPQLAAPDRPRALLRRGHLLVEPGGARQARARPVPLRRRHAWGWSRRAASWSRIRASASRRAVAAGMRAIGFAGGSHIEPHHAEALAEAGALYVERDWEAVETRLFGG